MELDGLLSALEERANTARTIFMLLDSDADGLVAVEQVQRRPSESRHSRQTVQAHRGAWRAGARQARVASRPKIWISPLTAHRAHRVATTLRVSTARLDADIHAALPITQL